MSASKELLNRGSQYTLIEEEVEAEQVEPEPDPEEQERQRILEKARIQREEDIEYSVHGPVYYDVYPYPCICEDLKHDCDGNEMSAEDREFRIRFGLPAGCSYATMTQSKPSRSATASTWFVATLASRTTPSTSTRSAGKTPSATHP